MARLKLPSFKRWDVLQVGDLGEVIVSDKGIIDVHYIEEADGYFSWQLNPDSSRGDIILKTVKVVPLEREARMGTRRDLSLGEDAGEKEVRDYFESLSKKEKLKFPKDYLPKSLLKSKKAQVPLTMTKLPKLGSKGSGWHKEPVSHSYARKNGHAPQRVRGR